MYRTFGLIAAAAALGTGTKIAINSYVQDKEFKRSIRESNRRTEMLVKRNEHIGKINSIKRRDGDKILEMSQEEFNDYYNTLDEENQITLKRNVCYDVYDDVNSPGIEDIYNSTQEYIKRPGGLIQLVSYE